MTGQPKDKTPGGLTRKLAWFALLWLSGVLSVSLLAYGIRLMIVP
ncbi:DUF2474 domain-containing protein [Notoacmeibacter sp. MSK16QG-6]|nr:DUF2474 domain-containing protein [Notoacmeibacter sp. MSK16QG-6]MCP1200314.1 DUF2474 domain-containing protein [Notoacmeibacter sp. MSK16QG-6]